MSYNLPAMVQVQNWAHTSEEFDLRYWARRKIMTKNQTECGTTLCLAGEAAVMGGYELKWRSHYRYSMHKVADFCQRPGEEETSIFDAGRSVLGLSEPEADQLFSPDLTDAAHEAAGLEFSERVDTNASEEKYALDLLAHLIERATNGDPHMTEEDVIDWKNQWCGENGELLADCLVEW